MAATRSASGRVACGIETSRRPWLWGAALLASVLLAWWAQRTTRHAETVFQPPSRLVEPAPLCPWREPEQDLPRFFPDAIRYETTTRILSGKRLELQQRLGRVPETDEHSLQVHEVYGSAGKLGTVLTRRAKGEHGAIELVIAVDSNQFVRGLRLQRLREPPPVQAALEAPSWCSSFKGKSAGASLRLGVDIPDLPEPARAAGQVVADAIRTALILLTVADGGEPGKIHPH